MDMTVRNRTFSNDVAKLLAVAVAYAVTARLAFELASVAGVAPMYPAAGLAVGVLYVCGVRLWAGVFLGAVLFNVSDTAGAGPALPLAVGNTAAAVAGAHALGLILDRARPFERVRDVAGLAAASVVAPLIAASSGTIVLRAADRVPRSAMADVWETWFLGDAAGILAIAPLLIVVWRWRPRPARWDVIQGIALAAVSAMATALVFGSWLAIHSRLYLLFPLIVWAALFKGPQAVASVAAGVGLAGSWATAHGVGPLGGPPQLGHLALLDGFIACFAITGLVLAAVDGERRRALAVAREALVAERSAREQAEHASGRTSEILETIGDAFVTLGRDWKVEYANDEARRLGRVEHEDVVGRFYWDVVPEVVGTVMERRWQKAMERQQPAHFAAEVPRLGLWVDVHAYPTPERISLYFRDITRQRRLEQELALSRKMEVVGRLAGGVAHDFNNLLLAIRGYGELAMRRIERHDESAAADVGEMLKAAERGADLTRQLLAVGRRQAMNPEVLDLNRCVSELEPLLRRVIGEDVELVFGLTPHPVHVRADRSQIEQVVLNLAVNARDAMPEGGRLAISVSVPDREPAGEILEGRARLRVSDSGVGMSPDVAAQIFEPFYTTKGDAGTGLGLATVHGIVTQTGGHVEVRTEPGRGSCFDVLLPLSSEQPGSATTSAPVLRHGGRETVLVVEDDPSVRLITARLLEDRGYIAVAVSRGEEAIRLAQRPSLRIDLVLSDVVMPDLNGLETARRVRNIQPHAVVLLMSGYTDEHTGSSGVLAPGMAFIQKPFSGDQLAEKVREVLDARAER
jgi:signal transduction histidine kinase/integral membrane sensor domain MASE1/ActR/RegA family two-component response regulator